ncbi:hypothetical protein ACFLY0_01395, partial [Patescibacteria group bacterium]
MHYPITKEAKIGQIMYCAVFFLNAGFMFFMVYNDRVTNQTTFWILGTLVVLLILLLPTISIFKVRNGTATQTAYNLSIYFPVLGVWPQSIVYAKAQEGLRKIMGQEVANICYKALELMSADFPAGLQMFKDAFCGREDLFGSEQFEMIRKVLDKAEEHEARLAAEYCADYCVTVLAQEIVYQGQIVGSCDFENRMMNIAPMNLSEVFGIRLHDLDIANMIKVETEKRTSFLRQLRKHFGHMSNTALIADLNFHYNKKHDKVLEQ